MKVWLLTSGSYSDYSVMGVFSSLENLEKAKAEFLNGGSGDCNDPEEFEVDGMLELRSVPVWKASIDEDGRICDEMYGQGGIYFRNPREHVVRCHDNACIEQRNPSDRSGGRWGWMCYTESAESLDHAKKLAIEKRQEWLRTKDLKQEVSS